MLSEPAVHTPSHDPHRRVGRLRAAAVVALLASVVGAAIISRVVAADNPAEASAYVPLEPFRVFDTRAAQNSPIGPVAGGTTFDVQITGTGVPSTATAVAINVTYLDASGPGFVTVFPAGGAQPAVSNLNKVGSGPQPNLAIVKLGTGGRISLFNQGGTANLFGDVAGYFVPTASGTGGGPTTSAPLDSAGGAGQIVASFGPTGGNWIFIGPIDTIDVVAGDRLVGAGAASIGLLNTNTAFVDVSMCYRQGEMGPVVSFTGANYVTFLANEIQMSMAAASRSDPFPTTGPVVVGFCVRAGVTVNHNDYVSWYVQAVRS